MKGLLLSLSQDYTVLEIHPLLRRYIISQNVIGLNVDEVFRYHPEFSFVTEVLTKMDAEKLDQHTVNIPFHTRRVEFARMKFDRDVEVNVNRCCLDKEQSIFLFFTDNIEYLEEFYGLLREKENLYINSMTILKEISMTIMNEPSSKVAARKSVEMICRLFGVHSAIMRMLKNGRILEKYVSYGFEGKYLSRHLEVDIYNVPLYKRVIEERRTIIEENPEQSLGMLYKELTQFSPTEMFIVLPIMNNNQAMGILALNFDKKNRIVLESIDILENIVSELNFLQAKSDYFQELLNTTEKLKSLNLNIVTSLSDAIETRDPYTKGHSERVGAYSVEIARNMGLDDYELERLRIAGVLHDIGKVGIPDAILLKPSALSKNEFEIMKLHPELSAAIVSEIESFTELVPWVRYHHENFDGTGYPHKLKGKDIPLGARIIAVADAFDAMTSTRPYRKAMSIEKVRDIFRTGAGQQWDKDIVAVAMENLDVILQKVPTYYHLPEVLDEFRHRIFNMNLMDGLYLYEYVHEEASRYIEEEKQFSIALISLKEQVVHTGNYERKHLLSQLIDIVKNAVHYPIIVSRRNYYEVILLAPLMNKQFMRKIVNKVMIEFFQKTNMSFASEVLSYPNDASNFDELLDLLIPDHKSLTNPGDS